MIAVIIEMIILRSLKRPRALGLFLVQRIRNSMHFSSSFNFEDIRKQKLLETKQPHSK